MNFKITVSIVIPCYNVENYIDECLDSVLKQTLRNIEVICIDDGSSDKTIDILKLYRKKHNVTILMQNHRGASVARNLGINCASGEYIIFIDADDYYPNDTVLETLYDACKNNNVDISGGNLDSFPKGLCSVNFFKYGLISFRDNPSSCGFTRYMFKTDMLRKNQIYFPNYTQCEDDAFIVKAMVNSKQIFAINQITYIYRIIPKNIRETTIGLIEIFQALIEIFNIIEEYEWENFYEIKKNEYKTLYRLLAYKKIVDEKNETLISLVNNLEKIIARNDAGIDGVQYCYTLENIKKYFNEINSKKKEIEKNIIKYPIVLIYGAGAFGRKLNQYLMDKFPEIQFSLVVSKQKETILRKDVCFIDDYIKKRNDCFVLVAVSETYKREIEINLNKLGFDHYEIFSNDLFNFFCSDDFW